jgi:anti-sigma B factor antagonist
MRIEDRQEGETLVVKLLEVRLDAHIASAFKEQIAQYIDADNKRILLNLAATDFIDSSGLGAIVSALRRAGNNCDIAICELQSSTLSMFKLTRMDKVFTIYATEAEGLAG